MFLFLQDNRPLELFFKSVRMCGCEAVTSTHLQTFKTALLATILVDR